MIEKIDVGKVALLARLKLSQEEEASLGEKFNKVIGYIDALDQVEIPEKSPAKDESLQQVFNEDKDRKSEVKPEQFSPFMENGFFKVPKVID